ncbi:hypothetical protein N7462_000252 [Penicillium macrosclerotiorum]|uniref:uncharacterized protein n=1 Tax=Penicillium macrosclerotiorum TaxID=303699 RepID=UPI0025492662|nr:uncharacterized protein N7462_000252 [Penicillium macrosclerotiorum]KAJ5698247.1 hypothetical protein N7462_000252 [Penicillium macrosclerotiorum]
MMAVRSPLSVLSYHDTSRPFAGPDSMSLEVVSVPSNARNSKHSSLNPVLTDPSGSTDQTDQTAATETSPVASSAKQSEDTEIDEENDGEETTPVTPVETPIPFTPSGLEIQTTNPRNARLVTSLDEDEPPQSVIHAPPGFGEFTSTQPSSEELCDAVESPSSGSGYSKSAEALDITDPKKIGTSPISPPPLTTSFPPTKDWSDRATPRAQTRHDFEESERRTRSSSLEDIPESIEFKTPLEMSPSLRTPSFASRNSGSKEAEINALRAALTECWTLCNTLASLSYINRERLLRSHKDGKQEDAWRSCWRLCQKLYDTHDDDYASQVNPTLDLCRDFCQALFEVRVCDSDLTDSVLRVSFELNNHLYNTHDRNLPDAFRERTLDFYITLCHRLMKQRTRLTETDSLLSACWSLAEMLFSIRQSKKDEKPFDEELLGSAVQACWELCDIFREGWTLNNMRSSDRGTPRPSQTTFSQAFQQATQQSELEFETDLGQLMNPETPTTIFEDTATVSPDEAPVPNILVFGYGNGHTSQGMWPSNASSISEKSRSSGHTVSSTNTVTSASENPNFTRLKALVTKAAINSGYQRGGAQNLSSFVKSLPSDAFGSAPWQISLLKNYRKLVAFDPVFRNVGAQARVSAIDMARACQAMVQSGQYSWLRDLYRLVFGFHLEEAMGRKSVSIQT